MVITNGHPDVQRSKLAASRVDKLIEHILVGGEEIRQGRPEKPAASIFLRACSLVGCQPHEVKFKLLASTLNCPMLALQKVMMMCCRSWRSFQRRCCCGANSLLISACTISADHVYAHA